MTLAALASSAVWLVARAPRYEATSQVLVTPLSANDQTFFGLQLLRDSGDDPTRVLKTAATILRSPRAALQTAQQLRRGWSPKKVLENVNISPEAQSSLLEVTAGDDSAEGAARLANTYTKAALDVRAQSLKRQIDATIDRLARARRQGLQQAGGVTERISQLEAIRESGDPTLSVIQSATAPGSTAGVSKSVLLLLSLIVGLTLGGGAAILLEIVNRRIRDEAEAVELYPLPVLARVPLITRRPGRRMPESRNGTGWVMPSPVHEAFRTVLVQVAPPDGKQQRVILVTSASTGDGKTASSINLALSLIAAGNTVVLMDFDTRKPEVARSLGLAADAQSLVSLEIAKLEGGGFERLLTKLPALPNLSVLATQPGHYGQVGLVEALHSRVPELIAAARGRADYVIIDSPPLGEVSDALRIVNEVSGIIVVARPGHTNRVNFEHMRDLLERTAHPPAGLLIIGETQGAGTSYYGDPRAERRDEAPWRRRLRGLSPS